MGKSWVWQDQSRSSWLTRGGDQPPGLEIYYTLGIGCLQRIADSLEKLVRHSNDTEDKVRRANFARFHAQFQPFLEAVSLSRNRALERLLMNKEASSQMTDCIRRALVRSEPVSPYSYNDIYEQIDPVVAVAWRDGAVAYWDGISKLPLQVSGSKTKTQAKYAAWLSSLNGQVCGG